MYEQRFMLEALELAKKAFQKNEVPVGAVLIQNNLIIGSGYNKVIGNNSVIAHAEIIAINEASKFLNNYRLLNTALYTTLEPCHFCAKAIVDARIQHVYFGASEPKTGAIISIDNFFEKPYLNHKVSFSSGYLKSESASLLKSFFQDKRKN
jgi:tRNA(adenine34) deaminase